MRVAFPIRERLPGAGELLSQPAKGCRERESCFRKPRKAAASVRVAFRFLIQNLQGFARLGNKRFGYTSAQLEETLEVLN